MQYPNEELGSPELDAHHERALRTFLEWVEEIKTIREGRLYPGATSIDPEGPWAAYCKEWFGLTPSYVGGMILAAPVLRRRAELGLGLGLGAARSVATLDVDVQNVILDETTNRDLVKAKAKAARAAETAGLDVAAQIEAAVSVEVKPAKRKRKRKVQSSRLIALLGPAWTSMQETANYVQANPLSEMENDWAWVVVDRIRLELERITDQLTRPITVRDVDAEASVLLGGES